MGEAEKEERERQEAAESQLAAAKEFAAPAKEDWGGEEAAPVQDWSADGQPAPAAAAAVAPAAPGVPAPAAPAFQVTDDWAAQTETSDWAAQSAGDANTWGGSSQW